MPRTTSRFETRSVNSRSPADTKLQPLPGVVCLFMALADREQDLYRPFSAKNVFRSAASQLGNGISRAISLTFGTGRLNRPEPQRPGRGRCIFRNTLMSLMALGAIFQFASAFTQFRGIFFCSSTPELRDRSYAAGIGGVGVPGAARVRRPTSVSRFRDGLVHDLRLVAPANLPSWAGGLSGLPVPSQPAVAPNRGSTDAAVGSLESGFRPRAILPSYGAAFSGHPGSRLDRARPWRG